LLPVSTPLLCACHPARLVRRRTHAHARTLHAAPSSPPPAHPLSQAAATSSRTGALTAEWSAALSQPRTARREPALAGRRALVRALPALPVAVRPPPARPRRRPGPGQARPDGPPGALLTRARACRRRRSLRASCAPSECAKAQRNAQTWALTYYTSIPAPSPSRMALETPTNKIQYTRER